MGLWIAVVRASLVFPEMMACSESPVLARNTDGLRVWGLGFWVWGSGFGV